MATNLELKARLPSPAQARESALRYGAAHQGVLRQRDTYFSSRRGRLKLRESDLGNAELIYYERAEESAERWCHYIREPVVGDAAGIKDLLSRALGILVVVEKRRDLYLSGNVRIHIDEVEGLGTYLEFEVLGEESPSAVETMRRLREAFAVGEDAIIKGSYSDMLSAKKNLP